jgi:cell shape-determining protein MreC
VFIQKLQDENQEFKTKIALMKSHDEELKELRKMVEDWETTERFGQRHCSITNNNMRL